MKTFFAFSVALILAAMPVNQAFGAEIPLSPELEAKLNLIGPQRTAKLVYDVPVNGGTVGDHSLGLTLPAKSIITRGWLYTPTALVSAGSGTIEFTCEDAGNIKAAAGYSTYSSGQLHDAIPTGASTLFVKNIAADCDVKATVAGAAYTAGKLNLFLEYYVSD